MTRSPPPLRPARSLPALAPATESYGAHTPPHLGQELETSAETTHNLVFYIHIDLNQGQLDLFVDS